MIQAVTATAQSILKGEICRISVSIRIKLFTGEFIWKIVLKLKYIQYFKLKTKMFFLTALRSEDDRRSMVYRQMKWDVFACHGHEGEKKAKEVDRRKKQNSEWWVSYLEEYREHSWLLIQSNSNKHFSTFCQSSFCFVRFTTFSCGILVLNILFSILSCSLVYL